MTKPPYRVPSMSEISALPWNGFTVASTFAGGGGSSLGYRMAGFKVGWVSEFVEAARETYAANAAPHTVIDGRDIREVKPQDILTALGIGVGDLDVLDGSPPCASFSTAGKREKGWNQVRKYSDRKQRTDDLFLEYARLVDGLKPKVFVAENVSGLVKGVAKGYFIEILEALKACGYVVEARMLDAQWLGVPQARQRLIFIGVRKDLGIAPVFPKPLPYRYSVRDALPWIRSTGSIRKTGFQAGRGMVSAGNPCPTIMAGGGNGMNASQFGVEAETDISGTAIGRAWDRLPVGQYHGKYKQLIKVDPDEPSPTVSAGHGPKSTAGNVHPTERRKFSIAELKRICSFPDDAVLTGSYAQQWERLGRAVPPLMMRAVAESVRDGILEKVAHVRYFGDVQPAGGRRKRKA